MKAYNEAKLQIVQMNNNDIVTTSVQIGNAIDSGHVTGNAPERRRSIWD